MPEPLWPKCVLCNEYIYDAEHMGTKFHRSCHLIFRPIRRKLYNAHYRRYGRPTSDELEAIYDAAMREAKDTYAQQEIAKLLAED